MVEAAVILDGQKNCAVKITGVLTEPQLPWLTVVTLDLFKPTPRRVSLDHVEWAITGRIEVLLAWHSDEEERELIFPLASRGYMNFSDYGGLSNLKEKKSGHIELMVQDADQTKKGLQCFSIFLDLIKQGI